MRPALWELRRGERGGCSDGFSQGCGAGIGLEAARAGSGCAGSIVSMILIGSLIAVGLSAVVGVAYVLVILVAIVFPFLFFWWITRLILNWAGVVSKPGRYAAYALAFVIPLLVGWVIVKREDSKIVRLDRSSHDVRLQWEVAGDEVGKISPLTYESVDTRFLSPTSRLTERQKNYEWKNHYEGKWVCWKGEVVEAKDRARIVVRLERGSVILKKRTIAAHFPPAGTFVTFVGQIGDKRPSSTEPLTLTSCRERRTEHFQPSPADSLISYAEVYRKFISPIYSITSESKKREEWDGNCKSKWVFGKGTVIEAKREMANMVLVDSDGGIILLDLAYDQVSTPKQGASIIFVGKAVEMPDDSRRIHLTEAQVTGKDVERLAVPVEEAIQRSRDARTVSYEEIFNLFVDTNSRLTAKEKERQWVYRFADQEVSWQGKIAQKSRAFKWLGDYTLWIDMGHGKLGQVGFSLSEKDSQAKARQLKKGDAVKFVGTTDEMPQHTSGTPGLWLKEAWIQ